MEKDKGLWATPYRLVFGADTVIPIELSEPSSRIITIAEESDEDARRAKLDLVEEDRERAKIKEEAIKQQMAWKYNRKAHHKNSRKET